MDTNPIDDDHQSPAQLAWRSSLHRPRVRWWPMVAWVCVILVVRWVATR